MSGSYDDHEHFISTYSLCITIHIYICVVSYLLNEQTGYVSAVEREKGKEEEKEKRI